MSRLTFSILCLCCFWPMSIGLEEPRHRLFIVWDVGQGLWTTAIEKKACLHFDSGGERSPHSHWLRFCQSKFNKHYLSHLDWDHMSFLSSLKRSVNLCRVGLPHDKTRPIKWARYKNLKVCIKASANVTELNIDVSRQKPNELSRIFIYRKKILIPGDSTSRQEKKWSQSLPQSIRVLVLGHHGSHTSTSLQLLKALPQVSLAIASARQEKYGHPHPKVLKALHEQGIPILKTEDWGHIIIEMH